MVAVLTRPQRVKHGPHKCKADVARVWVMGSQHHANNGAWPLCHHHPL